jgi:hypothetical protein
MTLAIPTRAVSLLSVLLASWIGFALLLRLGALNPNRVTSYSIDIENLAGAASLATAVVLWLLHASWRGSAIRHVLILFLAVSSVSTAFSGLGVFFGASGRNLSDDLFFLILESVLVYGLAKRKNWARRFILGMAILVCVAGIIVTLSPSDNPAKLAVTLVSGFMVYTCAHPEVKKEFA